MMVDSIEQTDNPPPQPPKKDRNFLQRLLRPSKKKAVGVIAIASVLGLGYYGLQWWAKRNLPPIIESQASKLLNRPVDLGEIESISLFGVKVGKSVIPPTATEKDEIEIEGIDIGFNLFPVIFRRTLPIDVTLVKPQIYLDQAADGSWLTLNLPESEGDQELPVELDVNVDLQEADVTAVPYNHSPIKIQADGEGRYNTADNQLVEYDLDAGINRAKATLQGKTILKTGETDTKLLVKDLALDDVASLIPNSPVDLNTGVLNADLDVDIPSWEEITSASVEGTVNLQQVAGEVESLSQSLKAKSRLLFRGRSGEVNDTEATIGDLTARVSGNVDLDTGYDLNVAVLPVNLSSLQKTFALQLPVPVTGEVRSNLDITGEIKKPVITGSLASTKKITVDKEEIKVVNANFTADLENIVLKNLTILPVAGGAITADGLMETELATALENKQPIDFTKYPLSVTFQANLPTKAIAAPYYQLPSNIKVGNLLAEGNVGGTIQDLKALVQWNLQQGAITTQAANREKISGEGEIVYLNDNLLLRDTFFNFGQGRADIKANANLKTQNWQGAVNTSAIYLTPFLSQFQINGLDLTRPITLEKTDIALSGRLDDFAPEKIQGKANLAFNLDGGAVTLDSRFAQGRVNATADTGNLAIDKYVTNLKIPVTTQVSSLYFTSDIKPLLNIVETKDFSSIESNVTANVFVADGYLTTKGSLASNQWQATLNGDDINTNKVVNAYAPTVDITKVLEPISTQANLSGNLTAFQNETVNLPVNINNAAVQMGEQSVASNGTLTITNLLSPQVDIPLVDLAVTSDINLDRLPIEEFVATAAQNNPLLAERLNVRGRVLFDGNFQGRNLITDATNPENYSLTGDLSLNNFAFNDTVFEPVVAGTVNVQPASIISLNLQGTNDVIAASAVPCTAPNCRLPYLPNSLELRQGENTANPVIATGNRQEDLFNLNIGNFPLALLNLAPGKAAGIEGALSGKVTGDITANLYTFATNGDVVVEKPAVGYIAANQFAAKFNYDPQQNIAEVDTASLNFGNTEYDFNGGLNLATGAINGRLNIPQAYIQDIFTTLRWYTVEDALNLFQTPEYVAANQINLEPIITVEESIAQKLTLLQKIERQIQQNATAREASGIPTELDLEGRYAGEILLAGTINTPEVAFNVEGNDWQWQPQPALLDIVPPLGLVKEETQFIPIDQILAVGKLEGTTVNLQQAKLQVEDTVLSATGKLSTTTQDAQYQVKNLTVDTISKFVDIPVDVAGRIDTQGTIQGTIAQPQITGDLNISESAYNGTALPTTIAGNYNYSNGQLNFQTTEPSSIQVAATVPYPIIPKERDSITATAKIDNEAFPLLDAFTGGNITWVGGEGNADLQATANLELNREGNPLYNLNATGVVNLEQAQVNLNNPFFTAPIIATGKVNLQNQLVNVETLNATVAEKEVSVTGTLPILYPVANLENPLTVNIPEGDIEIEKLYKGGVAGNIIVTSAALTPTIGGEVSLIDGKVSIPQANTEETYSLNVNTSTNGNGNTNNTNQASEASSIVTTLDNLLVKIEDFRVEQSPLYSFGAEGELTLNGTADAPDNIIPDGTIYITRGDVDWLSSNFTLVRSRDNTLVFNPEGGVLNPYLDIQMKTEVSQLNNVRQLDSDSNEIPDNISQVGRTQTINIFLDIDGEVADIIPNLAQSQTNGCNIRPNNVPPSNNLTYSQTELNSLANCINLAALETGNARQLLNSPAINLRSTPSRRQGEIVNLLGNQFIGFAEQLQNSSEEELLELGVTQFVITPIQRRVFYKVEDVVVGAGRKVGLDYLRVYPYLEGIYEINRNSSIRSTYDYVFNEIKFEYQRDF
jgi:translocation and assembly module TamB